MPVLNLSALPRVYNTIGLSPSLSMPAKGDANSTTTSAVARGTIEIRENPTQDISALSRDTANSLNELGRIFDKETIAEQQELAAAFGEEAFRLAHNLPDDGSGRKVAVHAIIIVEIEKGFDNFYRLKRQLGDPGKGLQWHHIVEQSQIL